MIQPLAHLTARHGFLASRRARRLNLRPPSMPHRT